MSTILPHMCGLSASLRCGSETCARGSLEIRDAKKSPKIHHLGTIAQFCRAISSQLRHVSSIRKNLLSSNFSSTCSHNMVNFGPLAAEIVSLVWAPQVGPNFNGFRVLAALLRGTLVVGVIQTLRRWTEGATCIRQGGHHVGHWPTFLVFICLYVVTAHFYHAMLKARVGLTVCFRLSICPSQIGVLPKFLQASAAADKPVRRGAWRRTCCKQTKSYRSYQRKIINFNLPVCIWRLHWRWPRLSFTEIFRLNWRTGLWMPICDTDFWIISVLHR